MADVENGRVARALLEQLTKGFDSHKKEDVAEREKLEARVMDYAKETRSRVDQIGVKIDALNKSVAFNTAKLGGILAAVVIVINIITAIIIAKVGGK